MLFLQKMRHFIYISYKGTRFHGWQRQTRHLSIQQSLEESLGKIFKKKIKIHGCGRTDAGVHASQYFFHCDLHPPFSFDPVFRLNKVLPDDISVNELIPVDPGAHAQYDARKRTYEFHIHTFKDPMLNEISSLYPMSQADLSSMKQAAGLLVGRKDFVAFCKSPGKYKHTLCTIHSAELFSNADHTRLCFRITADRFLQGMVRSLMSEIINTGTRQRSLAEFKLLLEDKKARRNITFAYPQGLHLVRIEYPYLQRPEKKPDFLHVNQII